jgi:hypothetical protein
MNLACLTAFTVVTDKDIVASHVTKTMESESVIKVTFIFSFLQVSCVS